MPLLAGFALRSDPSGGYNLTLINSILVLYIPCTYVQVHIHKVSLQWYALGYVIFRGCTKGHILQLGEAYCSTLKPLPVLGCALPLGHGNPTPFGRQAEPNPNHKQKWKKHLHRIPSKMGADFWLRKCGNENSKSLMMLSAATYHLGSQGATQSSAIKNAIHQGVPKTYWCQLHIGL